MLQLLPTDADNASITSVTSKQPQALSHAATKSPTAVSKTVSDNAAQPHHRFLKQFSVDNPLNVCIIHGDPTKPNDILPGGKWDEDDFYTIQRAKKALATLGGAYNFTWLCNHDTLMDQLRQMKKDGAVDIVLQLCDEGWMNNGRMELHIVAFLEMIGLPYTGCGPKTMGITYDKQAVLKIAESIGIPVPKSVLVEEGDPFDPVQLGLMYPVLVKPNSTDGSFGITQKSVCETYDQVVAAVDSIRNFFHVRGAILVQEYLTGRDINVGSMERPDPSTGKMEPWVLPITEEDYSALPADLPKICGFESKWDESSPYYKIVTKPTTLSADKQEMIAACSRRLFRRIECRDYARFDWRLDGQGNPRLLEANPNCGWCWDGHLPKTAGLCGISYGKFFAVIIKSGLDRAAREALKREQDQAKKFVHVGRNGAENLISS